MDLNSVLSQKRAGLTDCTWQVRPQSCWAVWHFLYLQAHIFPFRGPGYTPGNCPLLSLVLFWSFRIWIHTIGSLCIDVFSALTLTSAPPTNFPRNWRGLNTNTRTASSLRAHSLIFSSRLNTLSLQQHSSSMHFEISFALYSAKRFHFFFLCWH